MDLINDKKTEKIDFRASPQELKEWRAYCKRARVPVSLLIRHAVDEYVKENPIKKSK